MRKYFRMPVFFLALFTSVQDKDGSSNLYKAIIRFFFGKSFYEIG